MPLTLNEGTLDLNDRQSVLAWIAIHPERHLAQLQALAKLPLWQELKRERPETNMPAGG